MHVTMCNFTTQSLRYDLQFPKHIILVKWFTVVVL